MGMSFRAITTWEICSDHRFTFIIDFVFCIIQRVLFISYFVCSVVFWYEGRRVTGSGRLVRGCPAESSWFAERKQAQWWGTTAGSVQDAAPQEEARAAETVDEGRLGGGAREGDRLHSRSQQVLAKASRTL